MSSSTARRRSDLPESVARFAQAEVAAGHHASIGDVLEAGVEVLRERAQAADQDWLAYAREEAAEGFAELARGECIRGIVDEHRARIDPAVRAHAALGRSCHVTRLRRYPWSNKRRWVRRPSATGSAPPLERPSRQ
jgi:hypothetical protein